MDTPLTPESIAALSDEEATEVWLKLWRDQLTYAAEQMVPDTCHTHPWVARGDREVPEPHGMHSTDGWDYMRAALTLALELTELGPSADPQAIRAWLTGKVTAVPNGEGEWIMDYACDGISPWLDEYLAPSEEDHQALLDAWDEEYQANVAAAKEAGAKQG